MSYEYKKKRKPPPVVTQKPAKCECSQWAYHPDLGPWRDGEHHPTCNATHPKACTCFACRADRGELVGKVLVGKAVKP